ncbi:MAG: aldehyde ferredoxin oxidoreductase family protein [Dehalococcoidales bacterium]|nr:aldehyde ferredoxin oxidoreductase family protein [Dehalococcoidales bacterium]
MGKILFVDLSTGKLKDEPLDEKLCRDFIGGYGIGARIIYSRQKAGVDPLGPENTLGFMTGPLTGTPALMGVRYAAVGKSPLTGGWGDASSGGDFAPHLKFAGYDGIFFTGISDKPVYLFIESGKAELKDASHLWGKDAYYTEDTLREEYGQQAHVSCIGPSAENLSLISCIVTKRGAAAGRSGMGAVMGSKKLKAVVVRGNLDVPIADFDTAQNIREKHVKELMEIEFRGMKRFEQMRKYGTSASSHLSAHSGDTPVKNWGGVGTEDLPEVSGLSGDAIIANQERNETCWHCPAACEGIMKEGTGEYKYEAGSRRAEYETIAAFGTMCLNNNTESIHMANDICNRYGLDTISAGCAIAFAIECYENGIITREDTEGIELTWGNHKSIVAMTEKMAKREGLGDILADGVKVAAERIGKGAEQYAVHIGGQELGMHDPKLRSPMRPDAPSAARYQMDATPGRHTQGFGPTSFQGHVVNATGLCSFGYFGVSDPPGYIADSISAVTGWDFSKEEMLKAGERIATMRHVFNLREGINPIELPVHPRITGKIPYKSGPLAGVVTDIEAQNYWNLGALDWDRVTTKPSKKKLLELGLDDVANELWPPPEPKSPSS